MHESHKAMLAAQRAENRSRRYRARCAALTFNKELENEKSPGFKAVLESELVSIFLLEAWMNGVAWRAQELDKKAHTQDWSRARLFAQAIADDTADRVLRNPEKEFGELAKRD